jgi:hypothetical protein
VNSKDAAGGEGVTQFGRALLALNIDIIYGSSSGMAHHSVMPSLWASTRYGKSAKPVYTTIDIIFPSSPPVAAEDA